jgi:sugar phosphate isomerase/epimerase
LGLEAYSLHAPFAEAIDITSFNTGDRRHAQEEILRAADAAAELGVNYFVIHPGPERGGFPDHERITRMHYAVEVLNTVSGTCRQRGMALVLENMLPHLFSGHVRDLMWILGALDTVDVGICLDTGHAQLAGDLRTVAHKLAGHLWMVHVSDNHGKYDDHLPAGDGTIDWSKFLAQLQRTGFSGTLMLEIAGQDDHQAVLAGAQRGRRHLREICRRLRSSHLQ